MEPTSTKSATMTVPEAGAEMGISRNLAYQLARDGTMPSIRLGRRIVVPRVAFERWLSAAGAKHSGQPAAPAPEAAHEPHAGPPRTGG